MSKISVIQKNFCDMNVLSIDVGTNCPKGGDSGSGGRTIFTISDGGGTDLRVGVEGSNPKQVGSIQIVLGGDAEARTFLRALRFAARTLKAQLQINEGSSREQLKLT